MSITARTITVLFLLCIIKFSVGWRFFHLGHSINHNIGELSKDVPPAQWFPQILDHFTPTDGRVWNQRYYTNDAYFKRNSDLGDVVFLYIGGEGEVNATSMIDGQWITYAKQYGALCFMLEHRFYGKSHPTPDMSTKNLQYLSSEQALADLANFIMQMNKQQNLKNPKWISFGGSYPGALAAWLRYKYPHLVTGSMSASGPLLAKLDFYEYMEVVEAALRTHSDKCAESVMKGTEQIEVLLKHMVGQRSLTKNFKLCTPVEKSISNPADISNLFETLSGNFAGVVQYNKDNRVGKYPKVPKITIDTLCNIMVNESIGAQVDRLGTVNALLLDAYDQKCLDYKYQTMIESLTQIKWDSEAAEGGRQWTYQTCTEFGYYQTSSHKPQLFGDRFPIDFFVQQCVDIFGPKFNETFLNTVIDQTNNAYGGLKLEVSNVVFVHGTIDPWHALGITKTVNNNAPAILIEGTAHCANMYPESPDDPPQLKQARVQVGQLIGSWLDLSSNKNIKIVV